MPNVLVKLADQFAQPFEEAGQIVQKKNEVVLPLTDKVSAAIRMGVLTKIQELPESSKPNIKPSNQATGRHKGRS